MWRSVTKRENNRYYPCKFVLNCNSKASEYKSKKRRRLASTNTPLLIDLAWLLDSTCKFARNDVRTRADTLFVRGKPDDRVIAASANICVTHCASAVMCCGSRGRMNADNVYIAIIYRLLFIQPNISFVLHLRVIVGVSLWWSDLLNIKRFFPTRPASLALTLWIIAILKWWYV